MKALIVLWITLATFNATAQTKFKQSTQIRYVGSNGQRGSSDAIIVDNVPLVHTAQILPVSSTNAIIGRGNIQVQFNQVFKNITNILKVSGSDIDQLIKLNIFLANASLIPVVQKLLGAKFPREKQPTVTFAIGELTYSETLISADAIAVSSLKGEHVKLLGKESGGFHSAAILPAGPVVYVSGQAAKGKINQATQATLQQLNETLLSLGLSRKDIVQIKSFLTPMSSLDTVKKLFAEFFQGEMIPPLVFVDWISADPVIEIELIASSPEKAIKEQQVEYITPPGMVSSPVYSKVSRLNFGKKVYLSGFFGQYTGNSDSEVNSVFTQLDKVLKESRSDFNNLLKATYYVSSDKFSKSLGDLRPRYYDPKRPPAASKAMMKGIGPNQSGISVDMIATIKE